MICRCWDIFAEICGCSPFTNFFKFGDFVDRIYLIEHDIKDTTYTTRSASYLDLHLEIDIEGRLRTNIYDKRDDFNFPIANFPFICSHILTWLTVTESLCDKWPRICSVCRNHNQVLFSFITYHQVWHKSYSMGATCGAGTAYPSETSAFISDFR